MTTYGCSLHFGTLEIGGIDAVNNEPAVTMLKIEAFRWDGELVARAFVARRTDLTGRAP